MVKIYIIAGLIAMIVIGGLYSYGSNMRDQRDRKAEQLVTAEATIKTMRDLSAAQEQAIIKLQAKERKHEDAQQKIRSAIQASPASDDAAVAPVLSRTLDELRTFQR